MGLVGNNIIINKIDKILVSYRDKAEYDSIEIDLSYNKFLDNYFKRGVFKGDYDNNYFYACDLKFMGWVDNKPLLCWCSKLKDLSIISLDNRIICVIIKRLFGKVGVVGWNIDNIHCGVNLFKRINESGFKNNGLKLGYKLDNLDIWCGLDINNDKVIGLVLDNSVGLDINSLID